MGCVSGWVRGVCVCVYDGGWGGVAHSTGDALKVKSTTCSSLSCDSSESRVETLAAI